MSTREHILFARVVRCVIINTSQNRQNQLNFGGKSKLVIAKETLVTSGLKVEEILTRHYCPIGRRHDHLLYKSKCGQGIYL